MIRVALLAALAMLVQDVLGVLLVQAEARNRASLSALIDSVYWWAGIVMTTISVTTFQGHSWAAMALVGGFVTAANVAGSYLGVYFGKRWIKERA